MAQCSHTNLITIWLGKEVVLQISLIGEEDLSDLSKHFDANVGSSVHSDYPSMWKDWAVGQDTVLLWVSSHLCTWIERVKSELTTYLMMQSRLKLTALLSWDLSLTLSFAYLKRIWGSGTSLTLKQWVSESISGNTGCRCIWSLFHISAAAFSSIFHDLIYSLLCCLHVLLYIHVTINISFIYM